MNWNEEKDERKARPVASKHKIVLLGMGTQLGFVFNPTPIAKRIRQVMIRKGIAFAIATINVDLLLDNMT